MPDLGKYAVEVLAAYGVSLGLLVLLLWATLRNGTKVRRALEEIEARRDAKPGDHKPTSGEERNGEI